MMNADHRESRRQFVGDMTRAVGVLAVGAVAGGVAGRSAIGQEMRWQIDPDRCVGCSRCATECVLDESAVKCVQCFDMCGYCDICTGYLDPNYTAVDTAAENQLCPTAAIERRFVEEKAGQKFYEYTIDPEACIGCGKCVKGCALMNGSLYLQVMQDKCVNCNECAISRACPTEAFLQVPAERPYLLKRQAQELLTNRPTPTNQSKALLHQVTLR
ncbi:4Fe-4S binding protein [Crateriforma conspicua]|uniref:Electron transport complex subunit RsxB n=1 Tax=Crateriforma conspicua TaxID=2527996 RepID=A0A5C5Y781_9PLAN|nr:4Fe-4S binding protein [Crateriforma conspicua]TWT70623.1 Electron transport complex subunit RsxB [Crateriforma conspicua]